MHILKFIVFMFLLFIMFHIINYMNYHSINKKCNTIYIPLIDKYKDDPKQFLKGYEMDDNLSFLKYNIK